MIKRHFWLIIFVILLVLPTLACVNDPITGDPLVTCTTADCQDALDKVEDASEYVGDQAGGAFNSVGDTVCGMTMGTEGGLGDPNYCDSR